MANFAAVIAKFGENTKEALVDVYRGSIIDLSASIIMTTPVDKGHLRNNWFLSMNTTTFQTTDDPDKSGASTIERAKGAIAKLGYKDSVYLVNNLVYSVPIEYDAWSKKAPSGMVRINTARWDTIVDANVRRVLK